MNEHHEPPTHGDTPVVPGVNERAFGQHLRRVMSDEAVGDHPAPETLVAFWEHTLSSRDEERILAHLGRCTDCGDFLSFQAEAGREGACDPGEVAAAWERTRQALDTSEPIPILERVRRLADSAIVRPLRSLLVGDGSPRPWRLAVELAGLVLLVGVSMAWLDSRSLVDELSAPETMVAIYSAETAESVVRRGPGDTPLTSPLASGFDGWFRIPDHVSQQSIPLSMRLPAADSTYSVRLLDADGALHWRSDELSSDGLGVAMLRLHRRFLDSGPYTLEVALQETGETQRFLLELVTP